MTFPRSFDNLRLLDVANSLFFYGLIIGSLVMSDYATSKRTGYRIRILGRLPTNLGDKISWLHASALLDSRNLTGLQSLDDGPESHRTSDAKPQNPITDTG